MSEEFIKWYNARGQRNSQITMEFMEEAFNAGMQKSSQRCAEIARENCVDSDGYLTLCETEDKIAEEFGLEDECNTLE